MLRYLRRLADKDLALDRSMIPLGSCTMKLNATAEMEPITWPEFGRLHPFAPADQAEGYRQLIADLERWLVEITGYDAVSLQPNAGSQGELAGLLAIRGYHREPRRRRPRRVPDPVLGPRHQRRLGGHGRHAGRGRGLRRRRQRRPRRPAGQDRRARRPTSPRSWSPTRRPTACSRRRSARSAPLVHDAGGQVYLDGANLNAMVGLARPGRFGADVSPPQPAQDVLHPPRRRRPRRRPGGGAARTWRRSCRTTRSSAEAGPGRPAPGPISAAPWGSAGILPIPWAYIRMMGGRGPAPGHRGGHPQRQLRGPPPPAPLPGALHRPGRARRPRVHRRPPADHQGDRRHVDDVAKRLIDYGFHAPTMSFPVAGTLMIEPTESEDLAELDRFCDAMIAIRAEIDRGRRRRVAGRRQPAAQRPPHGRRTSPASGTHPYTREEAAYPSAGTRRGEVLAAGPPHRRRLRRPQPRLLLPAAQRLRGLIARRRSARSTSPLGDSVDGFGRRRGDERRLDHLGGHRARRARRSATASPMATAGGTKASAMPCSSIGEKLPLVTMPAGSPSTRTAWSARGGRRPSTTSARSRRATPASFSAASAARPRNSPLSQRHDPAETGLQRGDARAQLVAVQRAGRPRGAACRGRRARPARTRRPARRPTAPARPRRAPRPRRRPRRCSRCRPRRSRRRPT